MDNFCLSCEKAGTITERKIEIPVGRKTFPVVTEVCENCGAYAVSPEIQDQIDAWGESFTSNFIEVQPRLSPVVHKYLDEYSKGTGLNKIDFIRLYTTFYLTDAVTDSHFQEISDFLRSKDANEMMRAGTRIATSVPLRYVLFKKLQDYSIIWNDTPAHAIEDAVIFCVGLKNFHDDSHLRAIAKALDAWVERARMIA